MSAVWNYFEKLSKDTAQCNLCSKFLKSSGNTSNLNKHLKYCRANVDKKINTLKRGSELRVTKTKRRRIENVEFVGVDSQHIKTLPEEEDEVEEEEEEEEKDVTPNSTVTSWNTEIYENSVTTMQVPAQQYQCPNDEEAHKEEVERENDGFGSELIIEKQTSRNAAITNAILYFICADCRPFNTLQSKGFLKLMETLDPHYEVPTETRLKELVTEKYIQLRDLLQEKLKSQHEFCVTCDIWTEPATTIIYVGITLHYLEAEKRKSAYIATIPLYKQTTPQNFSEKLLMELNNWNVEKKEVIAIVSNVGIMKNLFKGTDKHIPCFAHMLNRIVERMLAEEDTLELVDKIREICKYFMNSAVATAQLQKVQCASEKGNKEFLMDVKSSWISTYNMIERFFELSPYMSLLLLKDNQAPPMLLASDLNDLNGLMLLLKPFEYVTHEMSRDDYIPISEVIPLINCLTIQLESLEFYTILCREAKKLLLEQIHKRCSLFEHINLMALSTLLDPRFKNLHFKNEKSINNAISFLHSMETECNASQNCSNVSNVNSVAPKEFDFWSAHKELVHKKRTKVNNSLHDELSLYLKIPPTSLKSNPFETWEDLRETFPGLYRQFRRHAVIVASSVPAGQLFSEVVAKAAEERKLLKTEILNKYLFLSGTLDA